MRLSNSDLFAGLVLHPGVPKVDHPPPVCSQDTIAEYQEQSNASWVALYGPKEEEGKGEQEDQARGDVKISRFLRVYRNL